MDSDIQSVIALGIVILASGYFIYSVFIKKDSGCGSEKGCGCSQFPQKSVSSKKSPAEKK